jgi:hypothetical protein
MLGKGTLMPGLLWQALPAVVSCSSPDVPKAVLSSGGAFSVDTGSSRKTFAIVKITRTLVYDDHASHGGNRPDIDPETMRVVLDYARRAPGTEPVVRTYTVKIAVPSDRPRSWDINLGDDYNLLIATRGFTEDAKGVKIDGRVKSNYQLQLDEAKAAIGPNSFGFGVQAVGERTAVQVMNDEAPNRIFLEFDETETEEVTQIPPDLPTQGIDESMDAQQRRWSEWKAVRKRGLR